LTVDDLLAPKMDANPIPEEFATRCNCLKCGTQVVHAISNVHVIGTLNDAAHSALYLSDKTSNSSQGVILTGGDHPKFGGDIVSYSPKV
jgi:hypothetical protein